MIKARFLWLISGWVLLASTVGQAQPSFRRLLSSDATLAPVLKEASRHRVQILYTRIRRDQQGNAHFRTYQYRVRPQEYFYPASTIKLPAAVLALEKLNQLGQQVPGLTSESPLRIDSAAWGQTPVTHDTSSQTGRASIAQYVRKALLVSDNDAYNRLYEFVGPQGLAAGLHRHKLRHTVLRHRLSVGDQDSTARQTNPMAFFTDTSLTRPLYVQPASTFTGKWVHPRQRGFRVGSAYVQDGKKVDEQLDFSTKNTASLRDLQWTLRAVIFPESVPARRRFQLAPADHALLLDYLHRLPRESETPRYSATDFPDNYAKFLLVGGPARPLPPGVQIYNKIGQAYGFLLDNAYIKDSAHGVEFLLSAVLYVNQDGVLNDDQYEYDTVGMPFLQRLGQVLYEAELQRKN